MLLFFYSVVYYISLLLLYIKMGKKASKAKTRSSFCVEKRERERERALFFPFTLLHTLAWDNKIIAHTHTHTQCLSVLYNTKYCYY